MKVLLINPNVGYYTRALFNPLGLLSIGSFLKNAGHEVMLYDRCVDKTKLQTILDSFKPEIIGISVMSSRGLKDAIKISKNSKKNGLTVVWGGQLPSMQTELVLAENYVDMVSVGEGEEMWKDLLECIEKNKSYTDIKGLAYKINNRIIINPCRDFSDLSCMPISDFNLIDVPVYMQPYLGCQKMMYIYSSKGCMCRCAFCSNVNFHKSTHRKRPTDYVIKEIKYLYENHGLDGVYFSDELWCVDKSEVKEFCSKIKENNINIRFGLQLRIGVLSEDDYRLLYEVGCRWIFFGIESGSEYMQQTIHKNLDLNRIKPTIEILKNIGITTICSFIIGFPDETEQQLRDTVELINSINADLTPIYHFTPLPGTELFDKVIFSGKYAPANSLKGLSKVVATENVGVNLSSVPTKDLRVIRSTMHWKSFTNKHAYSRGKSFEFAKQTIQNGLHSISLKGPVSFLINGFSALYEFLYVFWYSHAYPSIKKKYNLN